MNENYWPGVLRHCILFSFEVKINSDQIMGNLIIDSTFF